MSLTELTPAEEQVLEAVLRAIRRIRYGAIQITIQDGQVMQIDRVEKERFAKGKSMG